jgi:hypothetical protein
MVRSVAAAFVFSLVLCSFPGPGYSSGVIVAVNKLLTPALPQFIVPGSFRSCLTASDPAAVIGFKNELMQTLTQVLRPTNKYYRPPLAASLNLEGSREMDRMFFSLIPNAEKIQERLNAARLSKDDAEVLAVLEDAEAAYLLAVKSFVYVAAQAYEKGGLDAGQVRQLRRALETYTNKGSFASESVDLIRGLEKAASAARDDATRAFAHGQAQVLLKTLANDSSFLRPEPLVYPDFADSSLSFFKLDVSNPKENDSASARVVENLAPALRKLQPGLGQEVLIAQFAADGFDGMDRDLIGDPKAREDLLTRLKVQVRLKGEQAGYRILFRDEVPDLKVSEKNEVIISLRHSEDVRAYEVLGMKGVFSNYRLEVFLVGAQGRAADVLVPAPIPVPLKERFHLASVWKWTKPVLAAIGAAYLVVSGIHMLDLLPLWGQIALVSGGLLALAGLVQLLVNLKDPSGKWKVRVVEALLVGTGVFAILRFAKKMLVRTAWGAALLAKLAMLFG